MHARPCIVYNSAIEMFILLEPKGSIPVFCKGKIKGVTLLAANHSLFREYMNPARILVDPVNQKHTQIRNLIRRRRRKKGAAAVQTKTRLYARSRQDYIVGETTLAGSTKAILCSRGMARTSPSL